MGALAQNRLKISKNINPSRHLPNLTIETLEQGVKYVQS